MKVSGAIWVAVIGSYLIVYSSAALALLLVWHWLAAHLSHAQAWGVALAIILAVRVYLGLRDARRAMDTQFGFRP